MKFRERKRSEEAKRVEMTGMVRHHHEGTFGGEMIAANDLEADDNIGATHG